MNGKDLLLLYTDGEITERTRAHTHRELIREWLQEPEGTSLDNRSGAPINQSINQNPHKATHGHRAKHGPGEADPSATTRVANPAFAPSLGGRRAAGGDGRAERNLQSSCQAAHGEGYIRYATYILMYIFIGLYVHD